MTPNRKQLICHLLKGIETGSADSVAVVNEDKYIQHNPQTHEGSEGLAVLFKRLSKTSPSVNIVRIFEDGDFIFAHTEYDFDTRNIGFEIFRFENNQAVEHWDNIQNRKGPNYSGHSMVDGTTELAEFENTSNNQNTIKSFIEDVLLKSNIHNLGNYFNQENYTEHNPNLDDNLDNLKHHLSKIDKADSPFIDYKKCHRILAEGNFVLSVCEGYVKETLTSFFDLYRLHNGVIVEHWDTIEAIPPRNVWKNDNGKF